MAPFLRGSRENRESREGDIRVSFKDRHYKDVSKEKAELVKVEYYDKEHLKWEGHATVYRREPQMGYESGSIDCVMVECQTGGCPWRGKEGSIHVYFDDGHRILVVEPHTDPMCEHIWRRLKTEVDSVLKETREDEGLVEPDPGTTNRY